MDEVAALPTLDDLRHRVLLTLCHHDALDPGQTPLEQALLTRGGKPCGLYFQVSGPRQLRNYAIWAGEENRVLFWDSRGIRFAELRLSEAPDPHKLAA